MENQSEELKKQEYDASEQLSQSKSFNRGKLNIEIKASFELDDAKIFDLNGEGLTIACVTSN